MFVLARKCRELLQMRQSQMLSWLFTPTSLLLLQTSFSHCALRICLILCLSSHAFHLLALKSIHLLFIVVFLRDTSCTIAVEVNFPRMKF